MCGIFALFHFLDQELFSSLYPSIEKHFYTAQSRGPEFSTIKNISENII